MTHDFKPPEHSFLDSMGRRHIRLDVDIMTCNGMRYFTTFRYTAPVSFDFSQGWVTDCSGLPDGERVHPVTMWHRHGTRAWDFLQAHYPGIRKAEGKQLKFIFNL